MRKTGLPAPARTLRRCFSCLATHSAARLSSPGGTRRHPARPRQRFWVRSRAVAGVVAQQRHTPDRSCPRRVQRTPPTVRLEELGPDNKGGQPSLPFSRRSQSRSQAWPGADKLGRGLCLSRPPPRGILLRRRGPRLIRSAVCSYSFDGGQHLTPQPCWPLSQTNRGVRTAQQRCLSPARRAGLVCFKRHTYETECLSVRPSAAKTHPVCPVSCLCLSLHTLLGGWVGGGAVWPSRLPRSRYC